jgi:hypothetical protein
MYLASLQNGELAEAVFVMQNRALKSPNLFPMLAGIWKGLAALVALL